MPWFDSDPPKVLRLDSFDCRIDPLKRPLENEHYISELRGR